MTVRLALLGATLRGFGGDCRRVRQPKGGAPWSGAWRRVGPL